MLNNAELKKFNRALGGKQYDRLPILFKALSDETRCKIARLLISKGNKDLLVNEIAEILGISQSGTSQHLKILEVTGIVIKNKSGRQRYYHINKDDPIVSALIKAVLS